MLAGHHEKAPLAIARRGRSAADLAFILPIAFVVGAALLLPTALVIYHAFTAWNPGIESPWVGLDNFVSLAKSETFHAVVGNQAYLLLGLPVWVFAPLIVATVLHERVAAPGVFRTVMFFPATVSPAIMGVLFTAILAPNGPLNGLLRSVGLDGLAKSWLVDGGVVKLVLIGVLSWATIGTGVVIFAAALTTLPRELLEAAELDGAKWWQRFRYVVLPALRPTVGLWTVLVTLTAFVAIFPWIFTLTDGGPGTASTTIDFDIYQNALSFGYFGTAAAEAVYLLIIVGVVLVIGRLLARRRVS